jgi:hypothetical protein
VNTSQTRRTAKKIAEIGWREIVGLPDIGIPALKAKIDTGARTSALHAVDLETFERAGEQWVSFHVPLADRHGGKRHEAVIVDERRIKNTSGVFESRYIIETTLVLGRRHWRIEVSLANRQNMELDLILGRTAVRRRKLLVDPGRSYLAGQPIGLTEKPAPSPDDGLLRTLKRGKKPAQQAPGFGERT